jgi:hypothetical protein
VTGVKDGRRYDRPVSDLPPPNTASPVPPPWPQAARRQWPIFTLLIVALLVTLGIAIAGWFRPAPYKPPPATKYTEQQVAAAKTKVCGAYHEVRQALAVAGARSGGSDATATLAVATSSRQALDVGSRYLLTKLAEEPATSSNLYVAVRKLAQIYQELTIRYLADANDAEIEQLRRSADEPTTTIDGLCG